jgi:CHASE3 domain sensor protein
MRRVSQKTVGLLEEMIAHHDQPRRVNELYQQVARNRDRVQGRLGAVFNLVTDMNTLGAFRRARADRAISHAGDDHDQRQHARMQRDKANVELLVEACDELHAIIRQAQDRMQQRIARQRRMAVTTSNSGGLRAARSAAAT